MFEIIKTEDYNNWIDKISKEFQKSQIQAAVKVNSEMLKFFWYLGKELEEQKNKYDWGSHFYEQISRDLSEQLPEIKSFSPRNLLYMNQFYRLYSDIPIAHQVDAQLDNSEITHQIDAQKAIFCIPWGHNKLILDRCRGDRDKALFYVCQSLENNWSRAMLMNFLGTNLYERQGKAINNFKRLLPAVQSDLASEITKDPYNFDFLTLRKDYDEKELKDALMDNITKFLLELGTGFAFVGREYRIDIGDKENYIDLLFYQIKLKCYVVLEVKITEFDSSFTGKLGTYMVAVNHQLKTKDENPTIGLLICKYKNNVEAQYALEALNQPIGVSTYALSKLLPEDFKSSMPSIEEIEAKLED